MGAFVNSKEKYVIPYDSLLHKVIDFDKEPDYIGIEGELFLVKKTIDGHIKYALYTGTLSGDNKPLTGFESNLGDEYDDIVKNLNSYIDEKVESKVITLLDGGELEDEE